MELRASQDVIRARLAARDLSRAAGLGVMDQTRFATAVSEQGRHALLHLGVALFELNDRSDERAMRIEARFMMDGLCGHSGQDAEAPGVRQLVDIFDLALTSTGTAVTVQIVRLRHRDRR